MLKYNQVIDMKIIYYVHGTTYDNAIKKCNLPIIHSMGNTDKKQTVFTRYEFEFMLNCLHKFLNL